MPKNARGNEVNPVIDTPSVKRFQSRGNLNISDVRKLSTLLQKDLKLTRRQSISSKHQFLTMDSPWHGNSYWHGSCPKNIDLHGFIKLSHQ